jgi:hypothetical protein
MKRLVSMIAIALAAIACLPAGAQAAFGINNFDVTFTDAEGNPAEAGSHPFALTFSAGTNFDEALIPEGYLRDLSVEQIPGFVGDTTAYKRCTTAEFLALNGSEPGCSPQTQVGIAGVTAQTAGVWQTLPIFNLTPPPGVLLRLGFHIATESIYIDAGLNQSPPYNAVAASRNTPQLINVFGTKIQLWGNPSDPRHDELRGPCGAQAAFLEPGDIEGFEFKPTGKSCPVPANPKPFLTMPTDCSHPLSSSYAAVSWNDLDGDGVSDTNAGSRLTHDLAGNPTPLFGCGKLNFKPSITALPTTRAAQSPTGLDFSLDVKDEGLTSAKEGARAHSAIKKAVVTLPEGMTANPSVAEGLEVCSEDDLRRETLASAPGAGCPEASKIGTLEVESPLVEEPIKGALYQASPHANLADDTLLAFYVVFKNPRLGVIVKLPVKVEPDPKTGQLIAVTEDIPQLPFSHFRLHFREGGRSPLVSPPLCGTYEASAELTPWSGGAPTTTNSAFQIVSGPNEGPCPKGGTPPFEPGFAAGSQSNAAGRFSPFSMRLTRRDGDQDLTRFDATLPPGVGAILAGVDKCPDAQIALAKAKTGIAELHSPSCPANSRVGSVEAGAGVGSQLTYVPGSIYLAGAFGGAPLSVVGVVPAVAGPFDVGTVVTRQALVVNPRTAEVTADGAHSDPLPHILAGIPLVVRDIQVNVDRNHFTYNPTDCDPFAAKASIWGGGLDPFSLADDSPVARQARYQAASCASLGFKPSLTLKLKGGTKRGDHPKLRGVFKPRAGDANLKSLVLRLPRSAFLDQGHIRTICTRVQFAAKACPAGAIYGHARAFTPVLSEPLEGPVYLRSSNHKLPDFVAALHGLVDVEAVARIDSKHGGIRATFTEVPDAPISKVVVNMEGGKKGLIVNSTNLCAAKHHADADFEGHNAKQLSAKPLVGASCKKPKKR